MTSSKFTNGPHRQRPPFFKIIIIFIFLFPLFYSFRRTTQRPLPLQLSFSHFLFSFLFFKNQNSFLSYILSPNPKKNKNSQFLQLGFTNQSNSQFLSLSLSRRRALRSSLNHASIHQTHILSPPHHHSRRLNRQLHHHRPIRIRLLHHPITLRTSRRRRSLHHQRTRTRILPRQVFSGRPGMRRRRRDLLVWLRRRALRRCQGRQVGIL